MCPRNVATSDIRTSLCKPLACPCMQSNILYSCTSSQVLTFLSCCLPLSPRRVVTGLSPIHQATRPPISSCRFRSCPSCRVGSYVCRSRDRTQLCPSHPNLVSAPAATLSPSVISVRIWLSPCGLTNTCSFHRRHGTVYGSVLQEVAYADRKGISYSQDTVSQDTTTVSLGRAARATRAGLMSGNVNRGW